MAFEQNQELVHALDREVAGTRGAARERLIARARRLSALYREEVYAEGGTPLLEDAETTLAYATFRMPATYAAVRSVLGETSRRLGDSAPRTHLDLGGGTGASVWAAADVWPAIRSTVIEQAPAAIDLGKRLIGRSTPEGLQSARWDRRRLSPGIDLPRADLVTMSYVLGELPEALRDEVVGAIGRSARTVALLEPGSRGGHSRILQARDQLLDAGMRVIAPCPHGETCPLQGTSDWCHMTARTSRTALHQEMKAADRNYEDEPFSYVVASREGTPAEGRIVRRPHYAKGRVMLEVCAADPGVSTVTVTKKDKGRYRPARDAEWGDAWPEDAAENRLVLSGE